jgi:hypothetical protein
VSDDRLNISLAEMQELYDRGIVGTKEFRSWLANHSPSFAEVRDETVDHFVEIQAQANYENWSAQREADKLAMANAQ